MNDDKSGLAAGLQSDLKTYLSEVRIATGESPVDWRNG